MELGIEGRVALVLGASRGIGRGIARCLAREGARVAVTARSADALGAVVDELGDGAAAFAGDTGDLERMTEIVAEVGERMGAVEILVLNTGGPPPGAALDNPTKEWEAAYRSLVLTPHALIEAALPEMRERGWGRIVSVSSTSIREPIPHLALSNAHRSATLGFLNTLAREVAGDGITVNTVATGRFATDRLAKMHGSLEAAEKLAADDVPVGRLGTTEEYGDLVAFLCSERAAYLTGAVVPLDGGLTRSS